MRDTETDPSEITVTYPAGKHTFTRTQDGEWALALSGPPELGDMPRVGPYDDAGVLRVLTAFLTKAAPADASPFERHAVSEGYPLTKAEEKRS